jgi:type IV secretory pathway TraG/TraD family ATPase VirD4
VLQDIGQLFDLYGKNGATSFIANSGCVVGLTPNDPETAEWMSNFSSKHHVPAPSFSQDGQGRMSASYSAQEEPLWPPDDIRELPKGHGLVWTSGHAAPQPVRLDTWYENPKWKHIGRKDPFHSD